MKERGGEWRGERGGAGRPGREGGDGMREWHQAGCASTKDCNGGKFDGDLTRPGSRAQQMTRSLDNV
jgi:hypothetical protein